MIKLILKLLRENKILRRALLNEVQRYQALELRFNHENDMLRPVYGVTEQFDTAYKNAKIELYGYPFHELTRPPMLDKENDI